MDHHSPSYEEIMMRPNRTNILFVIGLMLLLGISTAFAAGDDKGRDKVDRKRLKTEGILTVTSKDEPMTVRIDGKDEGPADGHDIYLLPGMHTVEVTSVDGKTVKTVDNIEVRRGMRNCICFKTVSTTETRDCPYRFHLEGPDRITEGDLVTFVAIPDVKSPVPLRYGWTVTPDDAHVTSGMGTPTITVDSTGLGGRTINAELDVNDDVYDNRCRQVISVPTAVEALRKPEPPRPFACDEFVSKSADDDKARFDNCVIQAQNMPDAKLYIIIYPGTDKLSVTRNTYDRLYKRALDYIVKTRGLDPTRIQFVKGSTRTRTSYKLWIVPAGADLPPID